MKLTHGLQVFTTLVILTFITASAARADFVAASVNAGANPNPSSWGVGDVGWLYTPSIDINLSSVQTDFSRLLNPQTVTEEVYDGLPSSGGTLLRAASFAAAANSFSGADFTSPVMLTAGHAYFFGFRNVNTVGLNVTTDTGATSLGTTYLDQGSTGVYSDAIPGGPLSQPILKFLSPNPVPAPPALVLFVIGGSLAAGLRRRSMPVAA